MRRVLVGLSPAHRFFVAAAIVLILVSSSLGKRNGDGGARAESTTMSGASFAASTERATEVPAIQFNCSLQVHNASISSPEVAWQRAVNATESLLSIWFNPSCQPFCFTNGSFWTDANALETLLNFKAEADLRPNGNNSTLTELLANVTAEIYATQNTTPLLVAPPYYDDALWWGLAWLRAYEEYGQSQYLERALGILDTVYRLAWNSTCGGGVWWSVDRNYKNAITNELFAALSSKLALTTRNQTIEALAKQAFDWFSNSGMLDPNTDLINDGLTSTCQNNNLTTWTYNQGVILSAATNMYKITHDTKYLNYTNMIACAALTRLVYPNDGVLMDICDPSPGGCDADASQFKGVFVRHLLYATKVFETVSQSPAPWRNDIGNMADILWANATLQLGTFDELGGNWQGPFNGATPIRQAAALDLLVFAVDQFTPRQKIHPIMEVHFGV